MMPPSEFIDFRDQVESYADDPRVVRLTLTLYSGEKYIIVRPDDLFILPRVVFVYHGEFVESCFLFDMICSVDVIYSKKI